MADKPPILTRHTIAIGVTIGVPWIPRIFISTNINTIGHKFDPVWPIFSYLKAILRCAKACDSAACSALARSGSGRSSVRDWFFALRPTPANINQKPSFLLGGLVFRRGQFPHIYGKLLEKLKIIFGNVSSIEKAFSYSDQPME